MSTDTTKSELYQAIGKVAQRSGAGTGWNCWNSWRRENAREMPWRDGGGLRSPTPQQHLQPLRRAGLVAARKEGLHVHYRLAGDDVVRLYDGLRAVAQSRLAEVDSS